MIGNGCYKCKCHTCINNTSQMLTKDELIKKGGVTCFNCENCYHYGHESNATNNYKAECLTYIKSDKAIRNEKEAVKAIERRATRRRKLFKVMM